MVLTLRNQGSTRTTISPIGLDIGQQSLRAAQLECKGHFWRVVRVTSWHRRESEAGPEIPEGLCRRIAQTLRQAGYRGRRVVAGLSIPEVELHTLEIPEHGDLKDPAKFADAVQWELERVAGVSSGRSASGYWRLPPSAAARTTAIGVVASATVVDAVGAMARTMGLDCDRVDASACALSRLGAVVHRSTSDAPQQVWSVLDVGHRTVRLILAVGETPVLVRQLGNGGERWTQTIAESLGLSVETAEVHKRDHGIACTAQDESGTSLSEVADMIEDVLRPDIDEIAGEVERSYEYVMRCYPDRQVGGMLLVGGGAALKGLDRYLATRLGIEVYGLREAVARAGTPLAADASLPEALDAYGCAIGLAVDPESSP